MEKSLVGVPVAVLGLVIILGSTAVPGLGQGRANGLGGIQGSVQFAGVKPHLPQISMQQDPVCASEQNSPVYPQDGQVNANGTLPNAFVYVKEGPVQRNYAAPSTPVILNQVRCEYVPHVLGIMVGQPLKVLTSDPTTHNIHVMPKDNRSWNITQEPGSQPITERFTHPEIMIPVKCNQHPWMKAYIGVTTNPFYAVTGKMGTYAIQNVPAGHYTLEAWTAIFGTEDEQVTVEPDKTVTINFRFTSH